MACPFLKLEGDTAFCTGVAKETLRPQGRPILRSEIYFCYTRWSECPDYKKARYTPE